MKKIGIVLLWLIFGSNAFAQFKVIRKIPLPGEGFWDYLTVDSLYNRLFLSHGTVVQVVNMKSGELLHTIEGTSGVHGITLAYDLNKGYTSNGRDSSVTVFNLKTLEVMGKVKINGANPDAILYDVFSHKTFVFNGRSHNATVLDAKTDKELTNIELDGKPEFAVTDGQGNIFVNVEDKSLIARIDASTLKVTAQWPLAPGEEPSGLAIDKKDMFLYSVCDNKTMVVTDISSGKVISNLPIGERVDGVAYSPSLGKAFSSNGEGTVTVVQKENKNKFKVVQTVSTQQGARTIALDPRTNHLFLPTAEFGAPGPATKENPKPRPSIKPGSFVVLELAPE